MFSVVFLQKYGWYIIFGLIALSFVKKNLERHIQVSQFTDIRHFIPTIRSRAHNNKIFSFLAELIQFFLKMSNDDFYAKMFRKAEFHSRKVTPEIISISMKISFHTNPITG